MVPVVDLTSSNALTDTLVLCHWKLLISVNMAGTQRLTKCVCSETAIHQGTDLCNFGVHKYIDFPFFSFSHFTCFVLSTADSSVCKESPKPKLYVPRNLKLFEFTCSTWPQFAQKKGGLNWGEPLTWKRHLKLISQHFP